VVGKGKTANSDISSGRGGDNEAIDSLRNIKCLRDLMMYCNIKQLDF
jgi:hypothetical protein